MADIADLIGKMAAGQDLVVAGHIALEGTRTIAIKKQEELLKWFTNQYLEEAREITLNFTADDNIPEWEGFGAAEAFPVNQGGIMASLWNISAAYELGMEVELRSIPIRQITVEICERFDLNPYRMKSGGCMLLAAENGLNLVHNLKMAEIHSVVIGRVTCGIKRMIVNGTNRSFLDRPKRDELEKLFPEY